MKTKIPLLPASLKTIENDGDNFININHYKNETPKLINGFEMYQSQIKFHQSPEQRQKQRR